MATETKTATVIDLPVQTHGAMVRHEPHGVALSRPIEELAFTREQVQALKDTIAPRASDAEMTVFLATCKRMRLDPFARQIFLVGRWSKREGRDIYTPQVSIDGFRLVAERTGQYRGQTRIEWCAADGVWRDIWLDAKAPPFAARVGVHRAGFAEPLVRSALWDSYVQTTKDGVGTMWAKMPEVMLAKCAEAIALRTAFPNELGGVYTPEEMAQAENGARVADMVPPSTLIEADAQAQDRGHEDARGEADAQKAEAERVCAPWIEALDALGKDAKAARAKLDALDAEDMRGYDDGSAQVELDGCVEALGAWIDANRAAYREAGKTQPAFVVRKKVYTRLRRIADLCGHSDSWLKNQMGGE